MLLMTALSGVMCLGERTPFTIGSQTMNRLEERFGPDARRRLVEWQDFIRDTSSSDPVTTLKKVNDFLNQLLFVDDIIHWGASDYWATPMEFLASNGGDCEDFSIAKYFTLRALGVPDENLLLTYVKSLRLNQAHMVLAYYAHPNADPLILDNLTREILTGSKRTDLLPVYSFNASSLWIAKQRGKGKFIGGSDRLKRWRELMQRMEDGG